MPKFVQDFRKVLDDPSVDAIIVATPTTGTLPQPSGDARPERMCMSKNRCATTLGKANRWSRQRGNMNGLSRSVRRIAAHPTTWPPTVHCEGKLGKVHYVRMLNQKLWENFEMAPDKPAPQRFDWDMWNGPAPEHAYNDTFRWHWHHLWRYCIGDLGNDGATSSTRLA